ncbi:ABC transporter substrate-binding protein [Streptomyces radicis]|uniref:Extracellular solute-binding protein n=1 Tax=Streptomyces radicis TaxID=1750517 RepID=A0A3A9WWT6_9ACTN|nr:extracellular solute-binding protein [Streptomyces radicis]RKN10637.1 extracellular solute-binding protein [Streptomyces radicis]RKN24897.1 extracellular solute-binding protein [Streptomyces radicis]
MKRHTSRALRAGVAAATAGVTLAACGVGAEPVRNPELSDGDVTISYAWWGAEARAQLTLEAIELFEEEYPNIDVDPQYAEWGGYWDRMATTTAAGDMPDVSQFDQIYLSSYADRGALLDLSGVSNILDISALDERILETGRVDGTQYAVPLGGAANGVIINTTLFEEYGVELPDTSDWTWDEFTRAADDLVTASDGEVRGVSPFADSFSLGVWARQQGSEVFDDEGVALSADVLASFWQRQLDWIDSGAAPSVDHIIETTGATLDQTDLVTGRTAMAFIPAGAFIAYQSAAPDFDLDLVNWPSGDGIEPGFQYPKPTMYWVAASTSEHPAEAALLIDFLTNDTRVGEIFGLDRGEPANPAFTEAIEPDLDDTGREALAFSESVAQEMGDTPPITPNGASTLDALLNRYTQQALLGETSPREAAEGFINELTDSVRAVD